MRMGPPTVPLETATDTGGWNRLVLCANGGRGATTTTRRGVALRAHRTRQAHRKVQAEPDRLPLAATENERQPHRPAEPGPNRA